MDNSKTKIKYLYFLGEKTYETFNEKDLVDTVRWKGEYVEGDEFVLFLQHSCPEMGYISGKKTEEYLESMKGIWNQEVLSKMKAIVLLACRAGYNLNNKFGEGLSKTIDVFASVYIVSRVNLDGMNLENLKGDVTYGSYTFSQIQNLDLNDENWVRSKWRV